MFSSFFMFSFMFSFLYIVHFCRIIATALYPYLCFKFMFSFFMFSFLYIVHFCRIIAAALISSELISHPFPSQKGVIRGLLGGYYGVIRGIFSVRCYETNLLFVTSMPLSIKLVQRYKKFPIYANHADEIGHYLTTLSFLFCFVASGLIRTRLRFYVHFMAMPLPTTILL